MIPAAVFVAALFILLSLPPASSPAFTLIFFPSQMDVDDGFYRRWNRGSVQFMPDPEARPRVMSTKIDDDFLAGLGPQGQAEAFQAVQNALDSWSLATSSMISFAESQWPAVPNIGSGPPGDWEGPSIEFWQMQPQPYPFIPGWGANIEFFSAPGDTTFTSFDQPFSFAQGGGAPDRVAFAVVNRTVSIIRSAEVWLNEDYNWTTGGAGGLDVETVVLHELGHALGLDHPDQTIDGGCAGAAAAGIPYSCHPPDHASSSRKTRGSACRDSPNLDPFLWIPGDDSSPMDVMHSTYTGVKRQITDDEVGGMAFIYRPFAGDITGQFNCTLLDVAMAVQYMNGEIELDPRALAAADFMNRNGVIDAIELSYMVDWANNPNNYDQGSIPQFDPVKLSSTSMTVTAQIDPEDVGKGGQAVISLDIENPDSVPILAWTINVRYDEDVFVNPGCFDGNFPPAGFKIMSELEPGLMQIGKISASPTTLTTGDLGALTFDIEIPDAVALGAGAFVIEFAEIVVNDGMLRVYGSAPEDTLIANDAQFIASDLDVNHDGVVNLSDLYQWHTTPIDVNQDNFTTDGDREALQNCLRSGENEDLLSEH